MAKTMDNKDKNIFSRRLEELIRENNMVHENVAQGIGVTRQGVGKWVNGDSVPDVLTAAKLAEFFGVSVDYLAGHSDVRSADIDLKIACKYMNMSEKALTVIKDLDDNAGLCPERDVFTCLCEYSGLMNIILKSISVCMDFIISNDEAITNLENKIYAEESIDSNINLEAAADGYGTNQEVLEELNNEKERLMEQSELAKVSALAKIKIVLDKFAENYSEWLW